MKKKRWCLVLSLLLFTGCTMVPKVEIMVNGYLDADHEETIRPETVFHVVLKDEAENPLLEKEAARNAEGSLKKAGFKVSSLEEAQLCLMLFYGSGSKTELKTEVTEAPFGPFSNYYGAYGPHWSYHGSAYVVHRSEIVYHHRLMLQVFQAAPFRTDGTRKMVWVGEAVCLSSFPDLRRTIPYMLSVLFDHFGKDTKQGITIRLEQEDLQAKATSCGRGPAYPPAPGDGVQRDRVVPGSDPQAVARS